ncbi:MAG: aspartyl protease family protein [Thermoproteota archaeon]|nr:aspartyl protease family protein [Thermoproteota archaeon]
MGFTHVKVTIINQATAQKSDVKLLVDTGAALTSVPRKILHSLQIKPIGKRKLRLYGGEVIEREVGASIIRYGDVQAGVTIIFAEEEDTPVLGATALEALGYQVDPTTKQLKPVELLMI